MKRSRNDPCRSCSIVPHPDQCDNPRCTLWRRWFIANWDAMCSCPRRQMDRVRMEPMGVPLGGRYYAPPHRIREYRATDPCQTCAVNPFCHEKCKVRIQWEHQGGIQ